jgi:hypothetical protein
MRNGSLCFGSQGFYTNSRTARVQKYFLFIRDFIYFVSKAVLEHNGMIYQYVGMR